ncbi:hypothetical protein HH310_10030 [Actinoplanes sp. TBRC 11911]|uniref:SCO2521 family protein n=1 Tax=Actinoplanes sp. TBRC 11911 TaxID=2729386 RepID=UPI00145D3CA8|nr:SCO2521 family protein [Actinoplanes sp. TBRC 11911]NMO51527.1 hypothetical protein [Actinoplanes sp. TBRC 11911]
MLVVGEVDTGLLRGRDLASGDDGRRLVDLVAGERVLVSTRPRAYVRSPQRPVGVDCELDGLRRHTRGIGTVMQRAAIVDGAVVQGSAYATVVRADGSSRRPWSHYLSRPGVVETIGKVNPDTLADSLANPDRKPDTLDLGAVARRITGEVQASARGGGTDTLRAARSQLRWVARIDDRVELAQVRFTLHDRRLRLLRLTTSYAIAPRLAAVCEDVALHDWLVSTLIENVRKASIGIASRAETLDRLRPAIDHILHLWMPATGGDELGEKLWAVLERHAGFSRQWEALSHRIRDQLSVGLATAALSTAMPR